jgi:hypothetical protein
MKRRENRGCTRIRKEEKKLRKPGIQEKESGKREERKTKGRADEEGRGTTDYSSFLFLFLLKQLLSSLVARYLIDLFGNPCGDEPLSFVIAFLIYPPSFFFLVSCIPARSFLLFISVLSAAYMFSSSPSSLSHP